jgi:hypothetical protein
LGAVRLRNTQALLKGEAMIDLGPGMDKTNPGIPKLVRAAQERAKRDAEDVTKPLILDFYTWRTNPRTTLAIISERINKQFPQQYTGCFKVTIERN